MLIATLITMTTVMALIPMTTAMTLRTTFQPQLSTRRRNELDDDQNALPRSNNKIKHYRFSFKSPPFTINNLWVNKKRSRVEPDSSTFLRSNSSSSTSKPSLRLFTHLQPQARLSHHASPGAQASASL